jgi:hypothetical protein
VSAVARFGRNLKISVDASLRGAVRRFFIDGFGCALKHSGDAIDQFAFDDGASLGAFYVPAERALGREAYDVAPWLEFLVDDVAAAEARLLAAGGERVDFMDVSHPYLRAPGGPVFRLAKA